MACSLKVAAALIGMALVGGVVAQAAAQTEGIKVHGQWTIEVRNEDGTVVSHDEFHNDLVTTVAAGPSALAGLLSRRRVAGSWSVYVSNADFTGGPCRGSAQDLSFPCVITEVPPANAPPPTDPLPPNVLRTLTLSAPEDPGFGLAAGTIELEGVVRAVTASRIERVATGIATCPATVLTAQCFASSSFTQEFTARVLPVPVSVGAGQIVQIKVVFSFS